MAMTGPLPAAGDVIRFRALFDVDGTTPVGTHWYWAYSGGRPAASDLVAFANAVVAAFTADFKPLYPTSTVLVEVQAQDLSVVGGTEVTVAASVAGTDATSPVPSSAAANIMWEIARRYRGGRPRSAFPFGAADHLQNGFTWNVTFIGAVATAWAAMTTALTGLGSGGTTLDSQVSVSYFSGFTAVMNPITGRWRNVADRRTTPVVDPVVSYLLAPRIGSQRRRLQ